MKKYFFFDLDGTLCDTGEGVLNGVIFALSHFGINVTDKASLGGFMGPPLDDSFRRFFGFNDEQASEAVKIYREYYSETGVLEFTPYDGIKELLISLKNDGRKLFVATSKPVFYANKVLDKFGFSKYFDGIYGSEFDGTRSKKIDVLRYAVVQSGISDLNEGVMIGDREYDIIGAKTVGLESVGILFGYGSREEFEACGADHIFAKPSEIYDCFVAGK